MNTFRNALTATACCLALAACGKSGTTTVTTTANGTTTTSSTGTDGTASAADLGIKPGKWETTVQVTDFKMEGMPDMPSAPPAQKVTTCLTPEQASKGPAELMKNAKMDCVTNRSVYAGGRIDVDMSCKMPDGQIAMKSTGTFSPSEITTDSEMTTTGKHAMSQKTHTVARRVGECTG